MENVQSIHSPLIFGRVENIWIFFQVDWMKRSVGRAWGLKNQGNFSASLRPLLLHYFYIAPLCKVCKKQKEGTNKHAGIDYRMEKKGTRSEGKLNQSRVKNGRATFFQRDLPSSEDMLSIAMCSISMRQDVMLFFKLGEPKGDKHKLHRKMRPL